MEDEVCRGGSFHLPKWRIVNHFSGSWLKSSFATDRLPCGFRFWPPYNVWVRKHCDYLGTVQRNPLFVQYTGPRNLDTERGRNKIYSSHDEKTVFSRFQSASGSGNAQRREDAGANRRRV